MPRGHDLVIFYWGTSTSSLARRRTAQIAVTCTCYPRGERVVLARGDRMLAADAVAAWRWHLYDEGVIPREEDEDGADSGGSRGGGSPGRVLRPAGR